MDSNVIHDDDCREIDDDDYDAVVVDGFHVSDDDVFGADRAEEEAMRSP